MSYISVPNDVQISEWVLEAVEARHENYVDILFFEFKCSGPAPHRCPQPEYDEEPHLCSGHVLGW